MNLSRQMTPHMKLPINVKITHKVVIPDNKIHFVDTICKI